MPTTIETAASAARAGCQSPAAGPSATSKKRTRTQNTAALVATDMNAVTGVGAPSYTSGVHWWKGATESLNARPVAESAIPINSSGSSSTEVPAAARMPEKSVEPVAP